MELVVFIFYMMAIGAVVSGVMVVVQKNPVISALFLITLMLCLACIYLLLSAEFIAVIQVIVYAGAIMVLFLFVIMLLNLEKESTPLVKGRFQKLAGLVLVVLLVAVLAITIFITGKQGAAAQTTMNADTAVPNTVSIGRLLFSRFLLPFEITSVILLIAIIGVILIGKKKL
jgi:NADH-quinone oxidoreductase subunit J